ncbi:MAG TPA: hypothetical protein VD993_07265 [Chitinophagaceae bacterium]|nr:hypothetical protein [Chitinophagaceae bacterium]
MSNKLYALATISLMAGCFYILLTTPSKKQDQLGNILTAEAKADAPDEALLFEFMKTRDPVTGRVPRERLEFARQVQLQKFARQQSSGMRGPVPDVNWAERGPDSVGGRTRAMLYDRSDPTFKKVWAGGVGGGLWYTNDITAANVNWQKVSDTFNNLAVTAIAKSDNIMFFGTGEGWNNQDAIRGNGIWRSLDGGVTWEHMLSTKNNPVFHYVQDMAFITPISGGCMPGDLRIAATTRTGGVQLSLDTGKTWTKVLGAGVGGATIDAGADLEQEYYYIFATLGLYGQGGGGIFRSCDGQNWDKVYQATADEERIDLSVHYQMAHVAYAVVQQLQGGVRKIKKIMKTEEITPPPSPPTLPVWNTLSLPSWCDNGTINNVDYTRGQGWYDLIVAVQPIFMNHQNAFIGGVDMFKTSNSGGGWTQISQWATGCAGIPFVHADIHNIIFRPDGMGGYLFNDMLVATDGGIFRSTDGGNTFSARNKTYNVTQFYSCALHPTDPNYFLAGTQDNGTRKFTTAGMNKTTNIYTSDHDGGFCHIDQDDAMRQITSATYNNYFISTNGGSSFTYTSRNNRGLFINPTDFDNINNILYCGDAGGQFYRWTNPFSGNDTAIVSVSAFNGAQITHVRVSPTVNNRVYFGLSNGAIVQLDNAHTGTSLTGVVIRPEIGVGHMVSSIAIAKANESRMLVTYSNYGITSIYESSPGLGGSLNWTSVEGDLPDMPVRWAMFDPRNNDWAILATEMGIWSTNDLNGGGTDWEPTNNSFANTRVDMLEYRASDGTLAAVTHGRGLFTTIIPAAAIPVTLIDFRGQLKGNNVNLSWETATEQGNRGFDVERSSDGTRFNRIGFVAGTGNSNIIRHYIFEDKEIAQQLNYYRLKQLNDDGKYEYSRTILIKHPVTNNASFTVLNNPFRNALDLQFGAVMQSNGEIRLVDIKGQVVMKWSGRFQPGTRMRLQVPSRVAAGLYVVQLLVSNRQYSILARKE